MLGDLPVLSCNSCGACCEEQGLPPGYLVPALLVFLPEELREELAFHQREEQRLGSTRHERGLPCIWYDPETNRCRHYEYRPDACRHFPVGGEGCLFWRERSLFKRSREPKDPSTPSDVDSSTGTGKEMLDSSAL